MERETKGGKKTSERRRNDYGASREADEHKVKREEEGRGGERRLKLPRKAEGRAGREKE